MNATETDNKIITQQKNGLGYIILNHPTKLNAQSHAMTEVIYRTLKQWQHQADIKIIIIKSSSSRAFCAGGDIKQLLANGSDNLQDSINFFKDEYTLNLLIANYPKPIICFCEGITMGGGCGLSLHASHSIAADNIKLAMPETNIGLFPDIGATYHFSRMPHKIGYYLALTGNTIFQNDVLATDLMRYAMTAEQWQVLEKQLLEMQSSDDQFLQLDSLLKPFQPKSTASYLLEKSAWINGIFSQPTLAAVFEQLQQPQTDTDKQEFYDKTLQQLSQRSPHSLLITWQALQNAASMTLAQVLQQDLKLAKACLLSDHFYEGVKACLIDKREPHWHPKTINAYDLKTINNYFN